MAPRLFRIFVFALLTIALLAPSPSQAGDKELRPTFVFTSTRDNPDAPFAVAIEFYLMNEDGTDQRRLTNTIDTDGDIFASPSPDGKKFVFESNRRRIDPEPVNTSDLFVMNTDGSEQQFLTRGSSANWAPDGKHIVFHASASGTGLPMKNDPGAATSDSDIFVMNVDDCLELLEITGDLEAGQDPCRSIKQNITNTNATTNTACDPNAPYAIEDDANWRRDGLKIVFTSHPCTDIGNDSIHAEIYTMNADGTGKPQRLTFPRNVGTEEKPVYVDEEERAADWSPDGSRILFMCRITGNTFFQICVINADGSHWTRLTNEVFDDSVLHATPMWLTNTKIAFDMQTSPADRKLGKRRQLWTMNLEDMVRTQLTDALGINAYASYGVVRIPGHGQGPVAVGSTDRSADTTRGPAVHDGTGKDGTAAHGKHDKDKKDNKHNKHNKHKGGKRHR